MFMYLYNNDVLSHIQGWSMELTYRAGRHCIFMLHCHLIFITKYRGAVFNAAHLETLEGVCRNVCELFECELVEFNGESDHVHMLLNFPPKVAISKLVNSLKGVSSRKMKLHHPDLLAASWQKSAARA